MRVAIPVFGDEVSPRFGYNTELLIATIEEDSVQGQEVKDVAGLAPWQIPEFLRSLGVAKVICGGVHRRFQEDMERRGIEVIWGVIGPAADALVALRKGTLRRDQFVCRGRGGRRGCGVPRTDRASEPRGGGGGGRRRQGNREHGGGRRQRND